MFLRIAFHCSSLHSWRKVFCFIRVIRKVTLSSSCLWASYHLLSPLSVVYAKYRHFNKNLSMKCWNSAFNAQGSKLIIVVVHLGAVKISVAAAKATWRKERHDETHFPTKIDGFLSLTPLLNANVLFCRFFKISPCVWPNSGFWYCVFLTLHITLLYFLMEFSIKLGGFRE